MTNLERAPISNPLETGEQAEHIQAALTELAAHIKRINAANDNKEGSVSGISRPEPAIPFTEAEKKWLAIQNQFERVRDAVRAGVGALSTTGASTGLLYILNTLVEGGETDGWSTLFEGMSAGSATVALALIAIGKTNTLRASRAQMKLGIDKPI